MVMRGTGGEGGGATHELNTDVSLVKENPEPADGGGDGAAVSRGCRVTRVGASALLLGGEGLRRDQVGAGVLVGDEALGFEEGGGAI
jgi:hypothetical protein